MAKRVSIIGCGAAGRSFGVALHEAGYEIAALSSKDAESDSAARALIGQGHVAKSVAEAARAGEIVLLTVPDSAVKAVCDRVAADGGFAKGRVRSALQRCAQRRGVGSGAQGRRVGRRAAPDSELRRRT